MNDIEDEVPSRQNSSRLEEDIFLDDDPEGGEGFEDDDNPTALESGTETVLFDTGGQEEEFAVFPAEESNDEYDAGGEGDDAAPLRESEEENYAETNHHKPGDGARSPPEAWRAYCNKEENIFITEHRECSADVSGLLKLCAMPLSINGGKGHEDDPRWEDVRRFLCEATYEEKKVAAEEVTKRGRFPLYMACLCTPPADVVEALLEASPETARRADHGGWTPLHVACYKGAPEQVVGLLIDGGGGKEACLAQTEKGRTPLHFACKWGASEEVIRLLIDRGGGMEACLKTDREGRTPLHIACYYANSNGNIRLIVQNGGGMSCRIRDTCIHRFPLYYALGYGRMQRHETNKEKVSEDTLRLIIKNGGVAPLRDLLDVSHKDREMCLCFEEVREALNQGFTQRPVLAIMMLDLYFQGFLVAMMSLATKDSLEQNGGIYTWQLLFLVLAVLWRSLRELMQMASCSYQVYITDFWNWLDISQIILVSLSVAMMNSGRSITTDTPGRILLTVTVGIVWIALLGVMKNFLYGIAVFVSSLQQIVMELIPFLVVTAVTLSAFVFMFYSANINASYCESKDLEEKWYCGMTGELFAQLSSFVLTGLEIEADIINESATTAAILYAFGIVIALIFLNVLIAKISNVFSDVEKSGNEVFWRNRLSVVAEAALLLGLLKGTFARKWQDPNKVHGLGKADEQDKEDDCSNIRYLIFVPSPSKIETDDGFEEIWGNFVGWTLLKLCALCFRLFIPILLLIMFVAGFATCGVLWPKWMRQWLFFGKENVDMSELDTMSDKMVEKFGIIEKKISESEKKTENQLIKSGELMTAIKNDVSEAMEHNIKMGERMTGIERNISESEQTMDQLGERMNNIESRMKGMENKLDNLLEAVVKLNERSFSVKI
eukprot:CAMPEP_0197436570 /NCGR_PEP_ID=MMETSP1175-20131217/3999_1 /TAXON_ID=1003142 /ORGANISM="Triceratium dubium, Strain CCMP147" /LENGTH=891 /DNA_ID=CAMNT_0042965889 /DNA_START=90 /DNA_END=2765 /DNA_ORIENTATION=+